MEKIYFATIFSPSFFLSQKLFQDVLVLPWLEATKITLNNMTT
jgi:hypothetical protein